MEEKIKNYAKDDQKGGKYVPYSRQYDYVGPFLNTQETIKAFPTDACGQRIYEAAHANSHVIQQQVQKLFMSKSLVRWETGLKRGKINPTSLSRLAANDPRVFRRKIESNSRDVAVSLLIDMSGSMSGTKVQYAAIAALMFSQVLTSLNISHEVSAFTTYYGHYGRGDSKFPMRRMSTTCCPRLVALAGVEVPPRVSSMLVILQSQTTLLKDTMND
ncbi:DNA polymerase III subunit alpha [Xanthomonas phage JGB6]|nr:DNA polymerase III subunit alpha [Xanthomonas phage JGB6]